MDAEILSTIPLSGSFDELRFDAKGDSTWVKFLSDDGTEWCGVFGTGISGHSGVDVSAEHSLAFVVSAGYGYLVDVDRRVVSYKTKSDQIVSARFIPRTQRVVACNYTNIFIIEDGRTIWDSGRVSWDGIEFQEVSQDRVSGRVNDLSDDWPRFSLELESLAYSCPWEFRGE
jgi:hypothetical protein